MSKKTEADNERIPSYEESIATSPPIPNSSSTTPSRKTSPRQTIQQRTRQERTRRIRDLVTNHIEPAINHHLEDGVSRFAIILLPADSFPNESGANLSISSITSPTLSLPTTLLNIRKNLQPGEQHGDYKSAFLLQRVILHDLTKTIQQSMLDPEALSSELQPQVTTSAELTTASALPPRLPSKSWFQRKFGPPSADHDPTGSTGSWNLGWRSDQDPFLIHASVSTDEMTINTRVQDVSFRTESEMGLMESRSVKCIWLELDIRP